MEAGLYHHERPIAAAAISIVATAAGILVLTYSGFVIVTSPLNLEWLLLALVTVLLVSRVDIGIPSTRGSVALTDALIVASVILFGPDLSAFLSGLNAAARSIHLREDRKRLALSVGLGSASVFLSAELVVALLGKLGTADVPVETLLVAAGIFASSNYVVSSGLRSAVTALEEGQSILTTWRNTFLLGAISYFASAVVACLVVKLIAVVSFYAFVIAVPIITITYFTYKVYLDKVEASNLHAEQMADLHLRTIEALAIAIDAKDEVTHDHVHRVQVYATGLANLLGLSDAEIEALKAGALLHDIGKLAVPDYILNKPGALTPAEFDKMKVHTTVGADILERVGFPYPVVPIVRHHHERWDGRGYPDGLRADQIPMTARILAVADCFDAVREDRQYRKAMTREEAIAVLREGSGAVFDPTVVSLFLEHLPDFEAEIRNQNIEIQPGLVRREQLSDRPTGIDTGAGAYERIRGAHREVTILYDIAQTIGTSLDVRDTFAVFSSRLRDIVSYTTCILYLIRQDSADVEAAHVAGRNADVFKGRRMQSGVGITGWVVANGHPMHNSDPRLDFDALKVDIKEHYRAATVVPLARDHDVLGALALYSVEIAAYGADELRLIEAVAKLASDAIANAVHHQKVETNALTDSLTGLANARALRYRFEEECDRARRHRDIFSIVMMDLDGFKMVNDRLGHQAGDYLLRELAQLLSRMLRSSDFLCRYAGDEFVALLQIGPEEVQELVQRIQKTLEKQVFGYAGSTLSVGISAGWASFGTDGESLDQLLLVADRSMYGDKLRRKSLGNSGRLKSSDLGQYKLM